MVLDIANTAVARGKVYLARQKGERIPEGWAMDAQGVPTTDPREAIEGLILPMAGHKGYGITVMMDVLSGVLTGSGFASEVHGPYQAQRRSRCGHLAMAIDIEALQPRSEFDARMERLVAQIKGVPLAPGVEEVFYPGEIEARNDERNRRDGIALPEATVADLRRIARETGIPAPLGKAP
jgi:LDH2 family malate/lactate/ureidoglycolate dehydrogenase